MKEITNYICDYTVKKPALEKNYNEEASTVNTHYSKEQYCMQIYSKESTL